MDFDEEFASEEDDGSSDPRAQGKNVRNQKQRNSVESEEFDNDDSDDGEITQNSGPDESSRSNNRKLDENNMSMNMGSIVSIKKKHVEIGIEDLT